MQTMSNIEKNLSDAPQKKEKKRKKEERNKHKIDSKKAKGYHTAAYHRKHFQISAWGHQTGKLVR